MNKSKSCQFFVIFTHFLLKSLDIDSNHQQSVHQVGIETGLQQIYNQMLAALMLEDSSSTSQNSQWQDTRNDFRTGHGIETDTDNNTIDNNHDGDDNYNDDYQEITQDTYFYGGGASEEL